MEHSRKMAVIPFEAQESHPDDKVKNIQPIIPETLPEKKTSKSKVHNKKISNILEIVLKLAKIEAYDEQGRIQAENGSYVEKSNIANLIKHAITYGKALYGEKEFIELLKKAKINPDIILNENIKSKLLNNYTQNIVEKKLEPVVTSNIEIEPTVRSIKRRINEEETPSQPRKRKRTETNYLKSLDWELPD